MSDMRDTSESPEEDEIDEHPILQNYGKLHRNVRKLIETKTSKPLKKSSGEKHLSARYRITKYEPMTTNSSLSIAGARDLNVGSMTARSRDTQPATKLANMNPTKLPQVSKSTSKILFNVKQSSTSANVYPYRDLTNRHGGATSDHHRPGSRDFFENILGNIEQISKDSAEALKSNPPRLSLKTLAKLHTHRDFFVKTTAASTVTEPAPAVLGHLSGTQSPPPGAVSAAASNKGNFLDSLLQHPSLLPPDEQLLTKLKATLPEALECIGGNRRSVAVLENWYILTVQQVSKDSQLSPVEQELKKKEASRLVLLDLVRQSFAHCGERGRLMLHTLADTLEYQKRETRAERDNLKKQLKADKEVLNIEIDGLKRKVGEMEEQGTHVIIELRKAQDSLDQAMLRETELLALQTQYALV